MFLTNIVFYLVCVGAFSCIAPTRADEEDSFGDLLEDVALGFTIAACEADESCSKTMDALCLPILLVALITFCICPSKEEDNRNYKPLKPRRAVRTGIAYGVGRVLFN